MGDKTPLTYGLTCEFCSSNGPLFVIKHYPIALEDYIVCEKHREEVLDGFKQWMESA